MAIVGSAEIRITPVVTNFARDLQARLAPQLARAEEQLSASFGTQGFRQAGAAAGDALAAGFNQRGAVLLDSASKQMKGFEAEVVKKAGEAGKKSGSAFGGQFNEGFAALAAFAVAARVGRFFRETIEGAIEFETAFTGVRKVLQGTPEQMRVVRDEIVNLSKELPFAATEIAGVAQAAGQLGVPTSLIGDFTRTMLELGVSTNLSAEEAANGLARFAAAANFPLANIRALGSSIVALGNNVGATESEILDFAQNLAGPGRAAGLTADQMLALAASARRAGLETEAGATAISRAIDFLQNASAGAAKNQEQFEQSLSRLGVTADALTDPIGAFVQLLEGIAQREGPSATRALADLGLSEIRVSRNLRQLAGDTERLTEALRLSRAAFEANTALGDEFSLFAQTSAARLQVLRNQFAATREEIGSKLAPVLTGLLDVFAEFDAATVSLAAGAAGIAALGFAYNRFGNILEALTTKMNEGSRVAQGLHTSMRALGTAAIVATAINLFVEGVERLNDALDDTPEIQIEAVTSAMLSLAEGVGSARDVLSAAGIDIDALNRSFEDLRVNTGRAGDDFSSFGDALTKTAAAFRSDQNPITDFIQGTSQNVREFRDQLDAVDDALVQVLASAGETAALDAFSQVIGELGIDEQTAHLFLEEFATALQAADNAARGSNIRKVADDLEAVAEAARAAAVGFLTTFRAASEAFDQRLSEFLPSFGTTFADQASQAGRGAGDASNAAEEAAERIAEARRDLAEAEEDAAERISDARRNLTRTEEEASRRIRDALFALDEARIRGRRTFRDAQEELQDFQAALARAGGATTPEDFIRLRELEQAVNAARSDARRSDLEARTNVDDTEIQNAQDIADARRDLARTEEDAAERIADARRKLAEAIEDANDRQATSAARAADAQIRTLEQLETAFARNARDLNNFVDLIRGVEERVRASFKPDIAEAFLAGLAEMGPAAVPLLRRLSGASDRELKKIVKLFSDNIKAAKRAADLQFDKFPPNFRLKLSAANREIVSKLDEAVAEFEIFGEAGGAVAEELGKDMQNFALQLGIAVDRGQLKLTALEQNFLDLALAATEPTERFEALKSLLESLRSRTVNLKFKTDIDANTEKFIKGVSALSEHSTVIIKFEGINASLAAHGATTRAGEPFLVGRHSAEELFIPSTPGAIFKHTDTQKILDALRGGGSGGIVQNIQVNEVAGDPRATARAVSFAIGRRAIR